MRVPDLLWQPPSSPTELSQALAAAGTLWARKLHSYPFPDDEEELARRLKDAFSVDSLTPWHEPYDLEVRFVRHTDGGVLAAAWRTALRTASHPVRLSVAHTSSDTLPWYLQQLAPSRSGVHSVFVETQPLSPLLDWSWPLRIGVLAGSEKTSATEEALDALIAGVSWIDPLMDRVDLRTPGPVCDFLILPEGSSALSCVLNQTAPVRAHCLLLLEVQEDALSAIINQLGRLLELTQAKGALLLGFEARRPDHWLAPLVEELSHNLFLDLAAQNAFGYRSPDELAILFASRLLIDGSRLELHAARLTEMFEAVEEGEIEIATPRMAQHLGFDPEKSPMSVSPSEIAVRLRAHRGNFAYYSESGEATTLSRLTRSARRVSHETPASGARTLQCNAYLDDRAVYELGRWDAWLEMAFMGREPLREAFLAGLEHRIVVRVGEPDERWLGLRAEFPELPASETGHLLVVVFSEPRSLPEPLVSTILLPRTGPSSQCEFRVVPSLGAELFDARIQVLYENRVLQTARLQGPIAQLPEYARTFLARSARAERGPEVTRQEVEDERGILLVPECDVRPLQAGLEGRRRYAATLVVNHTVENDPQVTTVAGLRATRISLLGLEQAIKDLERTWNDMDWESEPFPPLDSSEARKLLRILAAHGRLLYDELVYGQGLAEALRGSEPLQVVAAHEGSFLPVEFCYTREPAAIEQDVPLCPQWRTALASGSCSGCHQTDDGSTVCPLGFWGLARVIEWHRFKPADRKELQRDGSDFAIQSEPTPQRRSLDPLAKVLLAASQRVTQAASIANAVQVQTWDDWKRQVRQASPTLLLLMVHTEKQSRLPSMEIGGKWLDPPRVSVDLVCNMPPPSTDPVVLLLGCGTGVGEVPFRSLPVQFRRAGAAIVVSTGAELHVDHAPRLAELVFKELQENPGSDRTFGEVMLAVRRKGLLGDVPIALALLCYGDADWRV